MEEPKISVIIPAYNCENYIDETISSILIQSYSNWEIIIIDDCSTDNTKNIIQYRVNQYPDKIKLLENTENLRQGRARNRGLLHATGEYIMIIDSDDLMHPDRMKNTIEYFNNNSDVDIIYGGYKTFQDGHDYQNGRYSSPIPFDKEKMYEQNLINNNTVCFKKGTTKFGNVKYAEDYWAWMYAMINNKKFGWIDKCLTYYRIRPNSAWRSSLDKMKEFQLKIADYFKDFKKESKKQPLVSIIMPTYNRPNLIKNSIISVLEQSREDWELIVVNDGGEDISLIIEQFNDNRIKYFNKENGGLSTALNYGIKKSVGRFIALLDDDDMWKMEHLQTLVQNIDGYDICYTKTKQIKSDGSFLHEYCEPFNLENIQKRNLFTTCSVLFDSRIIRKIGGFDESLKTHMDWDLWKRAANAGYKFNFIPVVTNYYIVHGENMLQCGKNTTAYEDKKIVEMRK